MQSITGAPNATPQSNFTGYLEPILDRLVGNGTTAVGEQVVIAETGFLTTTLSVQGFASAHDCFPLVASTNAHAEAWLVYLLLLARRYSAAPGSDGAPSTATQSHRFDMITWWSGADLLPASVQSGCFTKPCNDISGRPAPGLTNAEYVACLATSVFRTVAVAAGNPAWLGEAQVHRWRSRLLRRDWE